MLKQKRNATRKGGASGTAEGMQPPAASAVLAAQPLRTSRLKTCPRHVFFTPLTLSGFESLCRTYAKTQTTEG